MKTIFVGGGRGCRAVLELILQHRLATLDLEIIGVMDLDPNAPAMELAREQGWGTFATLQQAAAQPGLELIIELTGADSVRAEILEAVPSHVRVMDHSMARVFWDLEAVTTNLREELRLKTRLEEEIRGDRRRLQEIIDTLPDVVIVVREDGTIERVNQRYEEVSGLRAEDVLGKTCDVRSVDIGLEGGCRQLDCPRLKVMVKKKPITVIRSRSCMSWACRADEECFFEVAASPIFEKDGTTSVVLTSREVTDQIMLKRDREEAARRFDQIMARVHGVITLKDLAGTFMLVNPAAERFYKRPSSDFIGKSARDVFPAEVATLMELHDAEALETGEHLSHEELLELDGEGYIILSERFLLTGYQDKVVAICCVSRNVTAARRLQRELVLSEKHAAVGKLAAGVAHEINNPLTGILTFTEDLLEDAECGSEQEEDLQVIYRETLRCRQIVRDLLDYSRQGRLNRRLIKISHVVQRTLDLVRNQAAFHDITFQVDLREDELRVRVDPNQIQQVLLNLIINARDAMDGKGVISVASREHQAARRVELEVTDRGCGISIENRARIFEPFFSTKGDQGNGLGLAAVRSIIDKHDGHIEVQSSPEQGATFRIHLPGTPADEPAAEETELQEETRP